MSASAPTDARQQPEEAEVPNASRHAPQDEFEYRESLVVTVGIWLLVVGSALTAVVLMGGSALTFAGADPGTTILGVDVVVDGDRSSAAMVFAIGLGCLWWAVDLVRGCTDVPVAPEPGGGGIDAGTGVGPAVVWVAQPGTGAHAQASPAGGELLRIAQDASALSFTASGELVTVGADGTRLWDVASGSQLRHVRRAGAVAAISPDGEHVAVRHGSLGIVVQSLHDDANAVTVVHRGSLWKRGFGVVSALAFSRDGRRLASAGDPDTRIWDVADGRELLRVPTGPTEFSTLDVDFRADGACLATSRTERDVQIWDASDGRLLQRIAHGTPVSRVLFSPQERKLATVTQDGTAHVWDLSARGRLLCTLPDPDIACGRLRSLAWAPDATRLFAGFDDGTVSAWDTTSGDEVLRIDHGRSVHAMRRAWWRGGGVDELSSGPGLIAVSPDETMLATGGAAGTVRIWALA